jgi:hypothetical protein
MSVKMRDALLRLNSDPQKRGEIFDSTAKAFERRGWIKENLQHCLYSTGMGCGLPTYCVTLSELGKSIAKKIGK